MGKTDNFVENLGILVFIELYDLMLTKLKFFEVNQQRDESTNLICALIQLDLSTLRIFVAPWIHHKSLMENFLENW